MLMVTPWKHPSTGIYYTRIAIPQKLRAAFKARWGQESEIKISLRTKKPGTAKRRHHKAALEYQRRVDELLQPDSTEDLLHGINLGDVLVDGDDMSGDTRALERYLASAEKGSYADTGRAGGGATIQVLLNIERSKSSSDIVDVTPVPQAIEHDA